MLKKHLELEWVYEEEKSQTADKVIEETLIPPPPEEIAALLDLAMMGDMRGIRNRATHFEQLNEQYRSFANKLRELARGFEEKALLAFVKSYMGEGQS